jgi:hypothetical protein
MKHTELEAITRNLWSHADGDPRLRLFAVLDSARNQAIRPALMATDLEYRCLYRGEIPIVLAKVAPYLVELPRESGFLDFLINRGWGDSWGVFLTSTAPLDELRRHLRRFLRVRDPMGRTLVFRYYDPRVMRTFLPTCSPTQLESLFADIHSFVIENPEGDGMTEYSLVDSQLQTALAS